MNKYIHSHLPQLHIHVVQELRLENQHFSIVWDNNDFYLNEFRSGLSAQEWNNDSIWQVTCIKKDLNIDTSVMMLGHMTPAG